VSAPQGLPRGAGDRPRAGVLGIYAKSSPASSGDRESGPFWVDLATGEILRAKPEYSSARVRTERFALQSVVRSILPDSRMAKCLRLRQAHKVGIEVWKSRTVRDSVVYGGLQTCGSVWACPVCAAKISERRRVELLRAMEAHRDQGGDVLLLTLTNPHKLGDSLAEAVERQALAMSRFNSARQGAKLWASIDCVGTVRAWEVTHGANGWHPHFHLLLFVRVGLDLAQLRQRCYALWANSCRLAGLPVPEFMVSYLKDGKVCAFFGVDVQDGKAAAKYASKWGLESEMTKGHTKKARAAKGRTPFDLLRDCLMDSDRQAVALFKEFAECFKGRRQLVWSKGLKDRFALDDLDDGELAAQLDDSAALMGRIGLDQWRVILRLDLRADILELARHGWEPVQWLLDSLPLSSPGDSL
jgi:hypothetical protein